MDNDLPALMSIFILSKPKRKKDLQILDFNVFK